MRGMNIDPDVVVSAVSVVCGIAVGGLTVRKLTLNAVDEHIDQRAKQQVTTAIKPVEDKIDSLGRIVQNGLMEKLDSTVEAVREMSREQRRHGEQLARVEGQVAILVKGK